MGVNQTEGAEADCILAMPDASPTSSLPFIGINHHLALRADPNKLDQGRWIRRGTLHRRVQDVHAVAVAAEPHARETSTVR